MISNKNLPMPMLPSMVSSSSETYSWVQDLSFIVTERKWRKGPLSLNSCTNDMCERQCRGQVGSSLSLSSSLANKAKENTVSCSLSGKPSNNLSYISNSLSELLDARAWSLIASRPTSRWPGSDETEKVWLCETNMTTSAIRTVFII